MKEKGEISSNNLESVAGGNLDDITVQTLMCLNGFKQEWTQGPAIVRKGGKTIIKRWDEDFKNFLYDHFTKEYADKLMKGYVSQKSMFASPQITIS